MVEIRGGPYVILEGPDGTGKTYLAESVHNTLGAEYVHVAAPDRHPFRFYYEQILPRTGKAIFDRFYQSNYAYGMVFRHHYELTELETWLLEGTLMARRTLLIYCDTDPKLAAESFTEREAAGHDEERYEVSEKQTLVRLEYENFIRNRSELPWLMYDRANPAEYETIKGSIRTWYDMMSPRPQPGNMCIGNTVVPKQVFVADQPRRHFYSTAGRYMLLALHTGEYRMSEYCLVPNLDFSDEWAKSLTTEFVALGDSASANLTQREIPHRTIPAPEEWIKSNYIKVYDYVGLMRDGT